ncbi:hypothetical protein [Methanobrevibacter sp.]
MGDVKELKSIELSSFTTMMSGIAALFSIISAILTAVGIGALIPNASSIIIYLIPTIIVGTFMYTIYNSFCQGLLYNLLAKKLKTIAVIIKDEKEIVKISTTETAMMAGIILTIQFILLYLVSVFLLPLILTSIIQTLTLTGQNAVAYSIYQALMILSQPATIAMLIFGTFIITFVFVLLGTYIYNILGNSGRGIVLNLKNENGYTAIESVDSLKLAIAFAIISGVLSLIAGIISLMSGANFTTLIGNVLGGFVGGFIEFYLMGLFYNVLAPKIGKIKIELNDFKII